MQNEEKVQWESHTTSFKIPRKEKKTSYNNLACMNVNKLIQCLVWHSWGALRPHFLGNSSALAGLAPNLLRSDLCLQRQCRSAFFNTSQHSFVGFGGEFPAIAGRHSASSETLTLQTMEFRPVGWLLAKETSSSSNRSKTFARSSFILSFFFFSTGLGF